jgi:hypothetical protein
MIGKTRCAFGLGVGGLRGRIFRCVLRCTTRRLRFRLDIGKYLELLTLDTFFHSGNQIVSAVDQDRIAVTVRVREGDIKTIKVETFRFIAERQRKQGAIRLQVHDGPFRAPLELMRSDSAED